MNRKEIESAIERELESWPGASVTFVDGGKHPKAKLAVMIGDGDPVLMGVVYPGTPSDIRAIVNSLGDVRRALKKMGATRDKPEPTKEEDEAPYRKPNDGRAQRPHPVQQEPTPVQPDMVDQLVTAGVIAPDDAEELRDRARQDVLVLGDLGTTVARNREEARKRLGPDRDARAVILAEAEARVAAIVDGVYFDLPAEIYHAVPRLSASGIQKLCVSPATFWRGSWLDPERPSLDEEQTLAQLLGKAYHTARLEPHLFETTYVRALDKTEFPDALFTADQMKAVCEDIGLTKTGTKDVLADRLVDHGYNDRVIWTVKEREWEQERASRVALPAKHYDQMAADMDRIRDNGPINELLTGGFAEVSIFYTDRYGVQMKQRVDYLALAHWCDFKTFDNSRGKALDDALADAMRYNRYYIQASVYRDGVEAVRTGGLDVIGDATDEQRAFVARLRMHPAELDCHYVFQEKGGIPNLIAYEFPFYMVPYTTIMHEIGADEDRKAAMRELTRNRTRLFMKAAHEVVEAKKLFVLYSQVYPAGTPWFPLQARRQFTDEQFSAYWLEGGR